MTQQIAFMVMPFGVKPTATDRSDTNVPAKVNFDALWERVYEPALRQLGYQAVRADSDLGALVINDMIQRLAIADVVLADVTLPNANVYYEIGVRHAAKEHGCVLVAADWSKPPFDLAPMRRIPFPLPDGEIPEGYAKQTVASLVKAIRPRIRGTSPVFEAVVGYRDNIDESRMPAFRSIVGEIAAFDAQVRSVSHLPPRERPLAARAVVERYRAEIRVRDVVAIRLLLLLSDTAVSSDDWQFVLDYIGGMKEYLADRPEVMEKRALALGKKGEFLDAVNVLEQLINQYGGTSERYGLLGGRFKDLMREAHLAADRRRYLSKAIEAYEKGMQLDLNDYYPASNLPRLYRMRGYQDDQIRADEVAVIATEGCRRAIALGIADDWARSTLLGLAFHRGDIIAARGLVAEVEREGPSAWQLQTTLNDLRHDVGQHSDPAIRDALQVIVEQLEQLLV